MTGGRRNGGEVNVGGRGSGWRRGSRKRKKRGEGEHMWKSLQWVRTQLFFTVGFAGESWKLKAETENADI